MENSVTDNPYSAPNAEVRETRTSLGQILMYSPTQVACGTIGGPIGLVYFLRANFNALSKHDAAQKTLIYGALLFLGVIASIQLLPEDFSSIPFTVLYIVIARHVANKYQMTKQSISDSPLHDFQSNWKVFGMGLLCLLGTLLVIVAGVLTLSIFGIWHPEGGV